MRNVLFAVFLLLTLVLRAQNQVYSPYSYYGIGLPAPTNGVLSVGMGGLSQTIKSYQFTNIANPASYAANQRVNFEFNLFAQTNTLHDTNGYYDFRTYNFGRMSIALPIGTKKKAGACFGLMPYSLSSYNMDREFALPSPHTDYYTGTGGTNKVFLGTGVNIRKNLSVGLNINYLFGDLSSKRITVFDTASINNYYVETHTVLRGLNVDAGIQYSVHFNHLKDSVRYRKSDSVYVRMGPLKKGQDSLVHLRRYGIRKNVDTIEYHIRFGATYSSGSNVNATRDVYGVTFKNYYLPFSSRSIAVNDTVMYTTDESGKVVLPGSVAVGLALANRHKADGRETFMLGTELVYSNWSAYRSYNHPDSMQASYTVKLGGFYRPLKPNNTGYFNKVEYRFGGHLTQTPLIIRGTSIQEYGVSLGFGLPLLYKKHETGMANLAFEAGRMGVTTQGLLSNTYFRFSLGFNFTDETWFKHFKYD